MKYQNLSAFEKHLQMASKVHLSRAFLIISPCPYERKKIASSVVSAIEHKEGKIAFQTQDLARVAIEECIDSLNTVSMQRVPTVLFLEGIEKLKKNALTLLGNYVSHPSSFAYLLLGSASGKGLSEFYALGKKELIACDLSEEKPWDRKDRLKKTLLAELGKVGKHMREDALQKMVEIVGLNLASLEHRLNQLITYVAEEREITLQHVQTLCRETAESTTWQLVDGILWGASYPRIPEQMELGELFFLFAQLHTQLQQSLSLSILLEKGSSHADLMHYVPGIKPTSLEKMIPLIKQRKSGFFQRALSLLFESELLAKNSTCKPALIADLFVAKLRCAQMRNP